MRRSRRGNGNGNGQENRYGSRGNLYHSMLTSTKRPSPVTTSPSPESLSSPVANSSTRLLDIPLLTVNHINNLYTRNDPPKYNKTGGTIIHDIIKDAFLRNHMIDCTKYDRAFFTSDIHSDLRKFVQMLKNNELIDTELDPYTDDIYNPELIANIKWNGGRRTLLVIIGDLVDGKRDFSSIENQVDDKLGSFELLLFCLIYNLRVKAKQNHSEVLFNIGNHELITVIKPNQELYTKYVHETAKTFFEEMELRQEALLPFLNTSPYYMLEFKNGERREMASVHGGLHGGDLNRPTDFTADLETLQDKIDKGALLDSINDTLSNPSSGREGPIWSRVYSKRDPTGEGFCNKLGTAFPFIIVGHCPTDTYDYRAAHLIKTNPRYIGCDTEEAPNQTGCIVTDCDHGSGPRLAFVDVGMSKAFRKPSYYYNPVTKDLTTNNKSSNPRYTHYPESPNKERSAQMLLLLHKQELDDTRYFNEIHRVSGVETTGLPTEAGDTLLYRAGPPGSSSDFKYNSGATSSNKNRGIGGIRGALGRFFGYGGASRKRTQTQKRNRKYNRKQKTQKRKNRK